jgi:metal-responsive CopG/Arc/MetJ family transcriptional regulator
MRVAVSIPEPIFRRAERAIRDLRIPRSEFYARALETFVQHSSHTDVTARVNATLARIRRPEKGWENPGLETLRRG